MNFFTDGTTGISIHLDRSEPLAESHRECSQDDISCRIYRVIQTQNFYRLKNKFNANLTKKVSLKTTSKPTADLQLSDRCRKVTLISVLRI